MNDMESASPRISIGAGPGVLDSFFIGVDCSFSCFIETNVSSVLFIPPPVWRENVPGVSGVGMGMKDSKDDIAEETALRIPYLSQLRYLFAHNN